ncbi:GNAT family N-acetyltransferase [Faecalibaculum rodentium]|uniref:GNAT family N-acetyltransferase n=1 Tax=Faecalibaculum rodentium TaxID=1702221 RepID=UPI0023F0E882|nr:GNAT family N-acetyltransferase [Faecalibaculum rodentium]
MNYIIRDMKPEEYPLLSDFLYEVIFIPEGMQKPDRTIIHQPELALYIEDFGQADDICLVADAGVTVAGAIWFRIMNDYGHVGEDTPSLAIALFEEYRNQGIGTVLMKAMLQRLKEAGYRQVSLSVQKANYAIRMYEKAGFRTVRENPEECVMVRKL